MAKGETHSGAVALSCRPTTPPNEVRLVASASHLVVVVVAAVVVGHHTLAMARSGVWKEIKASGEKEERSERDTERSGPKTLPAGAWGHPLAAALPSKPDRVPFTPSRLLCMYSTVQVYERVNTYSPGTAIHPLRSPPLFRAFSSFRSRVTLAPRQVSAQSLPRLRRGRDPRSGKGRHSPRNGAGTVPFPIAQPLAVGDA
jgi:hypothetical protein